MNPTMIPMHEQQHPIQGVARGRGCRPSSRTTTKGKNHNKTEGLYLPRNPSRQIREDLHQPSTSKSPRRRVARRRPASSPPRSRPTPVSVSLDNVVVTSSPHRQSRWESQSSRNSEAPAKQSLSMPTRRRGSSPPAVPSRPMVPNRQRQQFPLNPPRRPTLPLKSVRRCGAVHSNTNNNTNNPHGKKSSPPRQKSPRSVILTESDDEEDNHVFVRRSGSNESLFSSQREDDLYKKKSPRLRRMRASKKPPPTHPQLEDNSSNSPQTDMDDSLQDLMRSLEASDEQGHIFLSARHLLSFASDEE